MCTTCSAYASRQVSLNFYDQKMFLLLCTWPAPILTGILSVSCFDSTWCALDFIVTGILSKLLTQNEMKQNAKNELSMSDERMRWIYNSILLHSFWLSIRVIEKKHSRNRKEEKNRVYFCATNFAFVTRQMNFQLNRILFRFTSSHSKRLQLTLFRSLDENPFCRHFPLASSDFHTFCVCQFQGSERKENQVKMSNNINDVDSHKLNRIECDGKQCRAADKTESKNL